MRWVERVLQGVQVNVSSYSGCDGRREAGGLWEDVEGRGDVSDGCEEVEEVVVEYGEWAKRREDSCWMGSGLRVGSGVNLEAGR